MSIWQMEDWYSINVHFIISLKCPKCGSEKFRSNLGFQNHCRLHCKLGFINTQDRIQKCGIPVEDTEDVVATGLPKQHPSQIEKEAEIAQLTSDFLQNMKEGNPQPDISGLFDGEDSDTVDTSYLRFYLLITIFRLH